MEYNNQLSENDKRFADEFSNYVNGKMASPRKVGKALADDHRYLVNEKAKLMFYFMEQLAENWHKGKYDQRNEWACRLAAETIDHLAENNLYHLPEEYSLICYLSLFLLILMVFGQMEVCIMTLPILN